jgi:GNAT superfamily N-acetyltransferase
MTRHPLFRALAGLALVTTLGAPTAHAADPATPKPARPDVNALVVTYVAAWNEQDPARRRELVGRTWAEDGLYVDAHRRGDGLAGIDAMIEKAQKQFPGYRLRLNGKVEAHNGYVRFSWAAGGTEQAPLYLGGTDFAVVGPTGRFQAVTGFIDATPALSQ